MRSLKSKLILTISLLIILLLSASAFLQIQEKQKELIGDIFTRGRAFSELTAPTLVKDYKLYLVPHSMVYFNRGLASILAKNEDISWIKIINMKGEILFDSTTEKDQQYNGKTRLVKNPNLLNEIKSPNLSIKISSDGIAYFKKVPNDKGNLVDYKTVDSNENPLTTFSKNQRLNYFVQPVGHEYAVVFGITYQALRARVIATQIRIIILAILGIALGIIFSLIFGSTLTKPLKILKEGAEIIGGGNFKYRVKVKSKDEIGILATTFNKMAGKLEESTKALVYKERVAKELELATQIQKQIIPKNIPKIKGIDLSAGIIPAEEIGGDCYDFLPLDKSSLLFYLGDVTGHGVPSGIIVSIANALFYTFADKKNLDSILVEVNNVLKEKTTPSMFLTLVLMKWDAHSGDFTYSSAGHEQIIHYKAKSKTIELLPAGGLALGMVKDLGKTLKVHNVSLQKNDVLVIYSDGIPEAWRNPKEMYGMDRFRKMVKEYSKFDSAMAIRAALMADVYMFRQGYKQMDDITCIVLKKN